MKKAHRRRQAVSRAKRRAQVQNLKQQGFMRVPEGCDCPNCHEPIKTGLAVGGDNAHWLVECEHCSERYKISLVAEGAI